MKLIFFKLLILLQLNTQASLTWETINSHYQFETNFPLNIVILDQNKWTKTEVIERIRRTEDIYATCDTSFSPINIAIEHRPDISSIDYTEKEDLNLLLELSLEMRPLIFFMNKNTAALSYPAWAWIDDSKVEDFRKRVGYVFYPWKRVERIDLALFAGITTYEVLAHELGHILLNHGKHLEEPDNIMSKKSAPMGNQLNQEQCEVLKKRADLFKVVL